MALSDNPFVGLPSATLTQLQTDYVACLTAIAVANQSYTINGRQFTRANLAEVRTTLGEINQAIRRLAGGGITQAQATV